MRRLRPALVLASMLAVVVTASCNTASGADQITSAQRKAIADEIERSVRDAYDLTKPNVDERMLSLYADTGRIVSASGGSVITSRDSLAQGIHYFWHNIGMNMHEPKWIWDQMLVDVLSPTAAVLTATYHVPHMTPRGQPHTIGGAWTMVFEKRGGRWRIVQEHLSDLATQSDSAMMMPSDSMAAHHH
jgi:ketosteroid isomerase-like protein